MTSVSIPYFDRKFNYSTNVFKNSIIQTYIALFISKPELYSGIYELHEYEKQSYFFRKFHKFLYDYYHFNLEKDFDFINYFNDLQINKKGSVNVCGGGDTSRNAKKNALKNFNQSIENNQKCIDYFNQKYKITINSEQDEREFIGYREIWKNPSPILLKKDDWEWVLHQSYDDSNFEKKIPDILNKSLVPLNIRNKAYQKWKNVKKYTEIKSDSKNIKNEEDKTIKLQLSNELLKEIEDLW